MCLLIYNNTAFILLYILYTVYTQRWLFEKCLFHSFTPYQDNTTPLYVASQKGYHDVVQTLLGAGADVNIARSYVSDAMFRYCSMKCIHTEEYHYMVFHFR